MSVVAYETELLDPRAQLQTFWEELDIPHGWHAEILEGTVVVTPPPAIGHNTIAAILHKRLHGLDSDDWIVFQNQAIQLMPTGDVYVPDLLVYPEDKLPREGVAAPAEHALLVVEITSPSNADHDRKRKLWGYAHGPVPLYLLVDRHVKVGPHVTLYSKPENGVYQRMTRVPFGDAVALPGPFDLKIDTARFPRG